MGRGVRVLKYEYEYGRLCTPRRIAPADEDGPASRRSMSAFAILFFHHAGRSASRGWNWRPTFLTESRLGNCRRELPRLAPRNAARVLHSTSLTYDFVYNYSYGRLRSVATCDFTQSYYEKFSLLLNYCAQVSAKILLLLKRMKFYCGFIM